MSRLPSDWYGPNGRRAKVLERDQGICHICHQPGADAVDHKNPGDDHSFENLGAIHQDVWPYCHRTKSAKEGSQAAQAKRALRNRPVEKHPGML